MDQSKIQRNLFTIVTLLLVLSILSLIAVIPLMLMDKSPGSLPVQAASGAFVGLLIHLALLAYLYGFRLSKHKRPGKKEISFWPSLALVFLGLLMLDGAFAFLDDQLYVSYGMFICAAGDFTAALLSFAALLVLRTKKRDK